MGAWKERQMNGWMDRQMDTCLAEGFPGYLNGTMIIWSDEWVDGCMETIEMDGSTKS
jgi:hypothetical protein